MRIQDVVLGIETSKPSLAASFNSVHRRRSISWLVVLTARHRHLWPRFYQSQRRLRLTTHPHAVHSPPLGGGAFIREGFMSVPSSTRLSLDCPPQVSAHLRLNVTIEFGRAINLAGIYLLEVHSTSTVLFMASLV